MGADGDPLRIVEAPGEAGAYVVQPVGELDLATVPLLEERLDALVCAERDTILDLSELSFLDSTGVRLLLEATDRARDNGWNLEVRDPRPLVMRTLNLLGVAGRLGLSES